MPDTTETNTPAASTPNTPDEAVNNTAANSTGTGTDTAQPNQATQEPTFTQAQVNAMIAKRLPQAVKAELKKMSGDDDTKPNVDDLQRQLSDKDAKIRSFEAKDEVQKYIADGRNKLNIRPENIRGIEALVIPFLEYDDNGKPSNLKDAIESAKSIAPALFTNSTPNINAHQGNGQQTGPVNMNGFIRQKAGYGS